MKVKAEGSSTSANFDTKAPANRVVAFRFCCDHLEDALRDGFVLIDPTYEELELPAVPLKPGTTMGNVLTGEKYDPADYTYALAVAFCPFCGTRLIAPKPESADLEGELTAYLSTVIDDLMQRLIEYAQAKGKSTNTAREVDLLRISDIGIQFTRKVLERFNELNMLAVVRTAQARGDSTKVRAYNEKGGRVQ